MMDANASLRNERATTRCGASGGNANPAVFRQTTLHSPDRTRTKCAWTDRRKGLSSECGKRPADKATRPPAKQPKTPKHPVEYRRSRKATAGRTRRSRRRRDLPGGPAVYRIEWQAGDDGSTAHTAGDLRHRFERGAAESGVGDDQRVERRRRVHGARAGLQPERGRRRGRGEGHRRPLPIAHVRSIREDGTHRMHMLQSIEPPCSTV